jgi:ribosomal-protein-alanine N-acetyltransferase
VKARADWRIAMAGAGDALRLAALHGLCFDRGWSKPEIAALLADASCACLCARMDDDAIAGFVIVRAAGGEAEILTLAVDPGRRRHGAGQALMREAAGLALERGAEAIYLEVSENNPAALALYEGLGYCRVGHRPDYYQAPDGAAGALVLRTNLGDLC